MYKFEPGEAFDLFYEGLIASFDGRSASIPADFFEKSIAAEPKNPYSHMYRAMMNEFMHTPDIKMKELCAEWLEVAKASGIEKQINRATFAVKYYENKKSGK
jgi:hypothetical protein